MAATIASTELGQRSVNVSGTDALTVTPVRATPLCCPHQAEHAVFGACSRDYGSPRLAATDAITTTAPSDRKSSAERTPEAAKRRRQVEIEHVCQSASVIRRSARSCLHPRSRPGSRPGPTASRPSRNILHDPSAVRSAGKTSDGRQPGCDGLELSMLRADSTTRCPRVESRPATAAPIPPLRRDKADRLVGRRRTGRGTLSTPWQRRAKAVKASLTNPISARGLRHLCSPHF